MFWQKPCFSRIGDFVWGVLCKNHFLSIISSSHLNMEKTFVQSLSDQKTPFTAFASILLLFCLKVSGSSFCARHRPPLSLTSPPLVHPPLQNWWGRVRKTNESPTIYKNRQKFIFNKNSISHQTGGYNYLRVVMREIPPNCWTELKD